MNAAGFPILSLITWLPLVGGLIIMSVRGDEETVASNARWTALWTSLIVLVLSVVLLFGLATKGFWLEPKEVRDLVDDENTRANRNEGMRWGFLFAMGSAIAIYVLTMFDVVTGREAVHIVLSFGIAAALLRWGVLERRAHRDA